MLTVMAVGIRAASDCLLLQRTASGMNKCELRRWLTLLCLTDTPCQKSCPLLRCLIMQLVYALTRSLPSCKTCE